MATTAAEASAGQVTPRWYMRVGRRADAKACLAKTLGGDVDGRLGNIQRELSDSKDVGWKDVLAPGLRRALWVGIGLAVFQQVTGINAVIYYSDKIFGLAGFPLAGAFRILDHHPVTSGGPSVTGIVTLIAMVVYIASFAFSLGPVVWTLISEIFPNRIRGKAMAVATAFNWLAAFIVSASFLSIMNATGAGATFLMFAVLCVIAFFWVRVKVPETKGKSLEQIQEAWAEYDTAHQAPKKPAYASDWPPGTSSGLPGRLTFGFYRLARRDDPK